jgi:hypothetical protein
MIMKNFICCFLLLFAISNQLFAQKNKIKLCLHDNPKLSPSYNLTYYWWDPYHIHLDGKELDPDGVKKDYYLHTQPPYDYCFNLKPGRQQFKVVSLFNDTISFDLTLQSDTSLVFQDYVKDFYKTVPNNEKLLHGLKAGDKLTIHFAKTFSNKYESLRIDMITDSEGKANISAINRKVQRQDLNQINYKNFYAAFDEIEHAAELLTNPGESGFVITIRKNRMVKEYKGRNDSSKIALVYGRIKAALNVQP